MVKLLAIIFSLYILLLPGLPCMEKDACADEENTAASRSASDHDNHENEEEGCTPFCNCVCCGHVFTPDCGQQKPNFIVPVTIKTQAFFYKSISLSADFFGNIWQPPKWC